MPDAVPDAQASPRGRFTKLIDDFQAYVESEKEAGATSLPATPALVAALGNPLPPPREKAKPAAARLDAIADAVRACTACPLHTTRTQAVPGQGHPRPAVKVLVNRYLPALMSPQRGTGVRAMSTGPSLR